LEGYSLSSNDDAALRFIAGEIDKTGYPLEIHASTVLESERWNVLHSTYYQDYDLQTYREIDIRADKTVDRDSSGNELFPYRLHLRIDVQCKKSDSFAWVFFLRPRRKEDPDICLKFLDYPLVAKTSTLLLMNGLSQSSASIRPPPPTLSLGVANALKTSSDLGIVKPSVFRCLDAGQLARTYKEVKRKRSGAGTSREDKDSKSPIYEAAITVVKATEFDFNYMYDMMHYFITTKSRGASFPQEFTLGDIRLYLPIILFDGELVAWQEKSLSRTTEVLLRTYAPSMRYPFPFPSIVVVHKDHFRDFLKRVEDDLANLANTVWNSRGVLDEQLKLMNQEFVK
jgi:hypothetical protein